MKKHVALITALLLFSSALITGFVGTATGCTRDDFENVIEASSKTIYIQSDGTVKPATAPLRRDGNTYTFIDNIYSPIVVDKENVVIDGAGYTLQGPFNGTQTDLWIIGEGSNQTANNGTRIPWTVGIDVRANVRYLTVKNLNIKNFSIGIWLWTSHNTITGNAITENLVGILLSGIDNVISKNCITNNRDGIFFGANKPGDIPANITMSFNGFVGNVRHLSGCVCVDFNHSEATHTWDNGQEGNFWSDYTGTDADGDGIGDTPYVIDVLNQDRYPLMQNPATAPTVTPKAPVEIIIVVIVLAAIGGVALFGRTRKPR